MENYNQKKHTMLSGSNFVKGAVAAGITVVVGGVLLYNSIVKDNVTRDIETEGLVGKIVDVRGLGKNVNNINKIVAIKLTDSTEYSNGYKRVSGKVGYTIDSVPGIPAKIPSDAYYFEGNATITLQDINPK